MKTIVLYKSNTGFTKAYAEILADQLSCESVSLAQLSQVDFNQYDVVIFGGSVRASKINGLNKVLPKVKAFDPKKVVIFAVGANGNSDSNTKTLMERNFSDGSLDFPFFYLQGGFDPNRLGFILKLMLATVAKSIKKKADKDPESLSQGDREFLSFFQDSHSEVSSENTEDLLRYLETLK